MYLSLATDLDPNWGWRRVDFPAKEISFESFSDKIINKKYSIYKVKIIFVGTSEVDEYDIDRMRVAFFNLYNNELVGDAIVSKKLKIIRD